MTDAGEQRMSRRTRGFLRFLERTLNRATKRAAHRGSRRFSIIRHVGRRSGRAYESVIIVAPHPSGFVAELTYGPDVAWHRNALAAGGAELLHAGTWYTIDRVIEPLEATEGRAAYGAPERWVLALLGRSDYLLLHVEGRP